jgi:hypothetical protein
MRARLSAAKHSRPFASRSGGTPLNSGTRDLTAAQRFEGSRGLETPSSSERSVSITLDRSWSNGLPEPDWPPARCFSSPITTVSAMSAAPIATNSEKNKKAEPNSATATVTTIVRPHQLRGAISTVYSRTSGCWAILSNELSDFAFIFLDSGGPFAGGVSASLSPLNYIGLCRALHQGLSKCL